MSRGEKRRRGCIGWWERFERFREERKKRRVLGAWVIYFSLAALPLFGLGEALIPVEETGRRQYAFWLMAAYVGSGLGLLLTTCFLSVRRYLRQRRLQMPVAMTAAWLTAGGGLIAGAAADRRPVAAAAAGILAFAVSVRRCRREARRRTSPARAAVPARARAARSATSRRTRATPAADKDAQATGRDKGDPVQDKDKGDSGGDKDKDKDKGGSGKDKDKAVGSERDKDNESP